MEFAGAWLPAPVGPEKQGVVTIWTHAPKKGPQSFSVLPAMRWAKADALVCQNLAAETTGTWKEPQLVHEIK